MEWRYWNTRAIGGMESENNGKCDVFARPLQKSFVPIVPLYLHLISLWIFFFGYQGWWNSMKCAVVPNTNAWKRLL